MRHLCGLYGQQEPQPVTFVLLQCGICVRAHGASGAWDRSARSFFMLILYWQCVGPLWPMFNINSLSFHLWVVKHGKCLLAHPLAHWLAASAGVAASPLLMLRQ